MTKALIFDQGKLAIAIVTLMLIYSRQIVITKYFNYPK